jgi:hypothetical protein
LIAANKDHDLTQSTQRNITASFNSCLVRWYPHSSRIMADKARSTALNSVSTE